MGTYPDEKRGGYPQDGYPQGGYPQGGYPHEGGYPDQEGYIPPLPAPGFQKPNGGAVYQQGYGEAGGPGMAGVGKDDEFKGSVFIEMSIRRSFIRKVYSILMCQLLVTMSFIALFLFHEPTKMWVHRNDVLVFWIAVGVMVVSLIAIMTCCENVRRKVPMNYIFLGVFTIAMSFLLGVTSILYEVNTVMMAVGITAAICLALTLFALQSKFDFTIMGGVIVCCTVVLMIFGFCCFFNPHMNIVRLIYASLGALVFSFYLIYDTQVMMGGEHKYSISPEEYIFAALNLYLDIVNLFLFILKTIKEIKEYFSLI